MAGSTVTSTLDIRLVDDVSPAAAKVAASLKKMETEALGLDAALGRSGTSDRMQASLKRLGASAPQIEGVAKAYGDFAKAQGIALGGGAKLTAEQTKAVRSWESTTIAGVRAVMSAEKARDAAATASFERSVSLWKSETAAHAREIERQVADDRRAAEQRAQIHQREAQRQARDNARELAAEQRHHHQMAERQAHAAEHHGVVNYALTSAAMAVSAHEIGHVIGEAWHQGAELQHERIGLQNAGRTPEEVREIEHASRGVIASTPTAGMIESLKTVAETTAAFGSVEHAITNLPFISRMTSILKTAGGDNIHGDAAQLGQAFAKTFEERQTRAQDFEAEARQMIPAMVATGGTFNPEQLYAFAQQAKSALPSLSMRFLSKIAPSLIGAQGGERAGTGLKAFEDVIAGKVNDKKQAEEFLNLGLLDKNMAVMKAGHAVGWKSGAVKDTFLAMTDPLAWSEQYLIPVLKKQGVDTGNREAVQMILNTMFRNQNANMFATEIAQEASRHRLHKDEELYGKVGSFDEIYARNLQDFGVAAGALKTALGNLAGAATAPLMHATAESLSWLAGNLNTVAAFGFQHPTLAATAGVGTAAAALGSAGWLGMKLLDGFGLKGSAVALTGSAEAITVAAGRLGVSGGLGGGPGGAFGKAENAAVNAGEGAAGGQLVGRVVNGGAGVAGAPIYAAPEIVAPAALAAVSAAAAGGVAVTLTEVIQKSFESQQPGQGGLYSAPTADTLPQERQRLANLQVEADELRAKIIEAKGREKIPGSADVDNYARQQRLDQLVGPIQELTRAISGLDAAATREARVGRAMMAMPKPEEFGPTLPDGWSTTFQRPLSAEEFGPDQPHLPDTDRADRARTSDLGWFGRTLRRWEGAPAQAAPAIVPPPVVDRGWSDARTKDDVSPYERRPIRMSFTHTPPAPDPLTARAAGPVPVAIVGGAPTTASAAPPPFHDAWADGDRPGIEERARRGAAFFRREPEAARGRAMMQIPAVAAPTVDTSAFDAASAKAEEVGAAMAAALGITVSPNVVTGSIDAAIAKAREFIAVMQQAGSVAASAGGGRPAPGAIRAAANRQFAGASQTG